MSVLQTRRVLVLNKSWHAIGVVSLKKAIIQITSTYKDGTPKARIIDCVHDFQTMTWEDWSKIKPKDDEEHLTSVNAIFRIPEVIMYTKYDKLPHKKVHYNRRTIFQRDRHTCQYCGKHKPANELSLDHVIPKCQGGLTNWENIVLACIKCNVKKAGRTPEQAGMRLLSIPKKPNINFFVGEFKVSSWNQFLTEAYWLTELDHD